MARPATRPARLKDGFYIEVRNPGQSGVRLRRDTKEQMVIAAKQYSKMKEVTILGEVKNDKFVGQ